MPENHGQPRRSPNRGGTTGAKYLVLGSTCLALAIVAGATASWIPLAIFLVIGLAFIVRGMAFKKA
jgi:hypothetical protein